MNQKNISAVIGGGHIGTFPEIVSRLSAEERRECAVHFNVAVSIVDRWAKGPKSANPHPNLKKQIVDWIRRRHAN